MLNNVNKNDKKYANNYSTYSIVNAIGRAQYYRHLANTIKSIEISEANYDRDIQQAREREDLLIQARRKWFKRAQRKHIQ